MPWWDEPLIGLDLETTSAEPEHARIVQAAVVAIGRSAKGSTRAVDRATWLVNPGVEIPREAIDVHGITNERVRADGDAPELVIPQVFDALRLALDEGLPVVVMNARYDFTVLDRELRRIGWAGAANDLLPRLRVVDPLVIDRHLDLYRPKEPKAWRREPSGSRSLTDCCRVWNVPLEGVAHDATFDAVAACRLAWRLMVNGRVIRRARNAEERAELLRLTQEWELVKRDPVRLHGWQREIARVEAERLEAWFRAGDPSKGVPAMPNRRCPGEWPVVPVGTDWGDPSPVEGPQVASEASLTVPD